MTLTTDRYRDTMRDVATRASEPFGSRLAALTHSRPSGTLRSFMESHHGRTVTTVQVNLESGSAWAPVGRTVDASRAGSVRLDGSTRDYKGCRVLARTDGAILVANDWHVIAYLVD